MKKLLSILLLGILLSPFNAYSIPSYNEVKKEILYQKNDDKPATQIGFLYNDTHGYIPGYIWNGGLYRFLTEHKTGNENNIMAYKYKGYYNETEKNVTNRSLGWSIRDADQGFNDNLWWWSGSQSLTYKTKDPYGFIYLTNISGSDQNNRNLSFYLYEGFECYVSDNADTFLNNLNAAFTVVLDTGVTYNHYQNIAYDDTGSSTIYYVNVAANDSYIDDNSVPTIFGSQYTYLGTAKNNTDGKQKYMYGEKTTESDYNKGRYHLEDNDIS